MKFMIIRKADAETEGDDIATEELISDMGDYMQSMAEAGILVGGDGLRPSREGFRVKFKDGKPTVVDGPFAETKELVAGYTTIEVDSLADAIEWTWRWPTLDAQGNVVLEIRQVATLQDFGEAATTNDRGQLAAG